VSDESVVKPLTAAQEAEQEAKAARENFAVRGLVAVDQAANVLTGGLPDETISSRLARDAARHDKLAELGAAVLDLFERDHCVKAQAGDLARAKLAAAAEENSGNLPGK
jgi:hypothetical protein